jgi:hypothetical protein
MRKASYFTIDSLVALVIILVSFSMFSWYNDYTKVSSHEVLVNEGIFNILQTSEANDFCNESVCKIGDTNFELISKDISNKENSLLQVIGELISKNMLSDAILLINGSDTNQGLVSSMIPLKYSYAFQLGNLFTTSYIGINSMDDLGFVLKTIA